MLVKSMACRSASPHNMLKSLLYLMIYLLFLFPGNILVRRTTGGATSSSSADVALRVDDAVQLIPIDHGFCLPESVESAYFEWLHWPQVRWYWNGFLDSTFLWYH